MGSATRLSHHGLPLTVLVALIALRAGTSVHAQLETDVDFAAEGVKITKRMDLTSVGGPGCQALQLTSNTKYVVWKVSPRFVEEETTAACLSSDEPVTLEVQLRWAIVGSPESRVLSGCENATFEQDDDLQALSLQTFEVLGTFQLHSRQEPLHFLGTSCSFGSIWIVGNTSCLGMTQLSIAMEVVNASDKDYICSVTKFEERLTTRQLVMISASGLLMIPLMILGCTFCCIICPGGCKCFSRPCCGGRCAMIMTYREKSEWMKLINAGGHSRSFTINLVIAGICLLQSQLYQPEMVKPDEYAEVNIMPYSVITKDLLKVTLGSFIYLGPQFEGILDWFVTMCLCTLFGFITYGALMMNYQIRGRDKSTTITCISFLFLIILNILAVLMLWDAFALISFFKYRVPYLYLYTALLFHLILTDISVIMVFTAPARAARKKKAVPPGTNSRDRCGPFGFLAPSWFRFRAWVLEDAAFKYSTWMLAAIFSAAHVVAYSYLSSLTWLGTISNCLADTEGCVLSSVSSLFFVPVGDIIALVVPEEPQGLQMKAAYAFQNLQNAAEPLLDQLDEVCSQAAAASSLAGLLQEFVSSGLLGPEADNITESLDSTIEFINGPVNGLCISLNTSNADLTLRDRLSTAIPALLGAVDPSLQSMGNNIAPALDVLNATAAAAYDKYETGIEMLQELADVLLVSADVGYTIGFVAGIYALVLTLANYKELVNNIRRGEIIQLFSGREVSRESKYSIEAIRDTTNMQNSIFFTGIVTSTAYIQLQVFGIIITGFGVVFGYKPFWTGVASKYWGYVVSIAVVLVLNVIVMRKCIGKQVCDNRNITKSRGWVAYYIISSFAQVAFGTLLAITRIAFLLITSLIAINRLDVNLFTVGTSFDNGYNSFMGMVAMVHAMHARERKGWTRVRYITKSQKFREYANQELRKAAEEENGSINDSGSHRSSNRLVSWIGSARSIFRRRTSRNKADIPPMAQEHSQPTVNTAYGSMLPGDDSHNSSQDASAALPIAQAVRPPSSGDGTNGV